MKCPTKIQAPLKESLPMSVKLLNEKTSKFVQESHGWTDDERKARNFGGATDALFYCYRHHLANVRILGQFADPRQNFEITLPTNTFE
jgi:hypothetical protein